MATPADDLLRLEDEVLKIAAGGYLDAVARIRALLATEPGKVRAAVLRLTLPSLGRDMVASIGRAWNMGLEEAVGDVDKAKKDHPAVLAATRRRLPAAVTKDAKALRAETRKALAQSLRMIRAGVDPKVAIAPILGSANSIERTLRTTVNQARNTAALSVGQAADQEVTIEAERDACTECLAYAGKVSKSGNFPGGLTFGPPKKNAPKVKTCPFHPNCRCRVVVLNSRTYAEALEREAERSILRGYALPSESQKARLDAAERLLKRGTDAPKSVQALARKAIKRGEFPDQAKPESARR